MYLLDPTYIRDNVDYSFGDESGKGILGGYMKAANASNTEFMRAYNAIKGTKPYMTLFCDNIRLYRREGIQYTANEKVNPEWKRIKDTKVASLANEDLLKLCASLPDMDFVIFCHFEDTPIDEHIHNVIPDNVRAIYASNAIEFGGKVKPMPYGLQRKLNTGDNRHKVLFDMIDSSVQPSKMLYINYTVNNNPARPAINKHFANQKWVTIKHPFAGYSQYLTDIKQHKFVLCPSGNAQGCECHRDWETIYMRRVPVLEWSEYLDYIFTGIPVLFVDSFFEVTEKLLKDNEHLLKEMAKFDLNKLDIKRIYENILHATNLSYQSR